MSNDGSSIEIIDQSHGDKAVRFKPKDSFLFFQRRYFEINPNVLSDELKNHQPVTSLAWNPQGTLLLSCCASDTTMVTFMCPSAQLT